MLNAAAPREGKKKKRSLLMEFNYSRIENWQVILIWVQM